MLSTSFAFNRQLTRNSKVVFKSTLTLADGTIHELTGTDFMEGPSFTESTSGQSSFEIGAAVIGKHDFTLRNNDARFDDFVFAGATVEPFIGVELEDGTIEWLKKGVFEVEQPDMYGNTIGLQSLDNMHLLEKPYSSVRTAYPASFAVIANDICAACGITLATPGFANSAVEVAKRPDDSAITCLDMISYIAQATGNWAKCDNWGRLRIGWYDMAAFESEDWLDGQTFDDAMPYASGDSADGGDFMSGGDDYDGGSFSSNRFILLHALSDFSVSTDDVVITGIRVIAADQVLNDGTMGEKGETALFGSEGYVLDVSENPLIQYGTAAAAASRIGARVVGMAFRPFNASAVGNPAYEAGDPMILIDRRQNQYRSYATSITYRAGSYETFSCGAETPSRNSAARYSAATKAIVENRKSIKAEKTARELALSTMALMLSSASGLYKTEQVQEDGSTVYYLHDKPTLAQSQTVWKATANAFGVSNNGGATYTYGVDSNGVAILNQIYATGIDADYITTGIITGRNGGFTLNLDTGIMAVSNSSEIGGRTIKNVLKSVDAVSTLIRVCNGGVLVGNTGSIVGAFINGDGVFEVVDIDVKGGQPVPGNVHAQFGYSTQIGESDGSHLDMGPTGIELYEGSTKIGNFGGSSTASGFTGPYFTLGERRIDSSEYKDYVGPIGAWSATIGLANVASSYYSMAIGGFCTASNEAQVVLGIANLPMSDPILIIGNGQWDGGMSVIQSNVFYVNYSGGAWLNGTLTQTSDRRLKEHIDYLGDDAVDFVRKLKPALFVKDGKRQLGFYAQDVQEIDVWDCSLVDSTPMSSELDFDPLTLEYTSLIAPLTTYAQKLEERIEKLEGELKEIRESLTKGFSNGNSA